MAIPLVRRCVLDPAQSAVGDAVAPQLRSLKIPGQAIKVVIGVACRARELALKAILRRIEESLAPAQGSELLGSTQVNGRGNLKFGNINNRQRIFEAIGNVGLACVRRNRDSLRVDPRIEPAHHKGARGVEAIGKLIAWDTSQASHQFRGVNNRKCVGFGRGDQRVSAVRRESGSVLTGKKVIQVIEHNLGDLAENLLRTWMQERLPSSAPRAG